MKLEEIFNEPGMYVADSFAPGTCFEVQKDGVCFIKSYKDSEDVNPSMDNLLLYKGLFQKDYKKVFTRQSLFKK